MEDASGQVVSRSTSLECNGRRDLLIIVPSLAFTTDLFLLVEDDGLDAFVLELARGRQASWASTNDADGIVLVVATVRESRGCEGGEC